MKRVKWILIAILIGGIGLACWRGPRRYERWRSEESLKLARNFCRQGQWNRAMRTVESSLCFDPNNLRALQIAAEVLDITGSPQALQCRQRIAGLTPRDSASQIALAATALRFNRLPVAIRALAAVPADEQKRLDFLEMEGIVNSALGQPSKAARAFAEIVRLAPTGRAAKSARVNLAQIWLLSRIPGEPENAMKTLDELAGDPEFDAPSLRAISQWDLQKNDVTKALCDAYRLAQSPNSNFEDRLRMLDILTLAECPLVDSALRWLQISAVGDAARTAKLAEWMIERRGPESALKWWEGLTAGELAKMPVPVVLADCRLMLKHWTKAESLLSNQNWGSLEPQRNALLSSAYAGVDANLERLSWESAVATAHGQKQVLASLARFALAKHRTEEAIALLWQIPDTDPEYTWARRTLFIHFRQENDLKNLLRLQEDALAHYPMDASTKRSIAVLLLIAGTDPLRASRLAREIYKSAPGSIANAAVYAYSLHCNGDSRKAAAILDPHPFAEKMRDDCLPYYALILAACDRKAEARDCFGKINRNLLFSQMKERLAEAEARCR